MQISMVAIFVSSTQWAYEAGAYVPEMKAEHMVYVTHHTTNTKLFTNNPENHYF